MGLAHRTRTGTLLSTAVLLTLFLSGCATSSRHNPNAVQNTPSATKSDSGSVGNQVPSTANMSTTKTGKRASNNSAKTVPLAAKPITLLYAGTNYNLPVPAADSGGNSTNVSAVAVPGGIVWSIPAGYPDVSMHPTSSPSLWFTPGKASAGDQLLWSGAKRLWTFNGWQGSTPYLLGATGGYVVIQSTQSSGATQIDAIQFSTAGQASTLPSLKSIATLPKGDLTGYGSGVFTWTDTNSNVHVVKLSTGAQETVHIPSHLTPSKQSASSSVNYPPQVVSGGVTVGAQFIPVKLIRQSSQVQLPSGYRWVGLNPSNAKDVAIPASWTVVKNEPGGSSEGLVAHNPKNPSEKVTLWFNACAGCYSPDVTSGEMVNAPDSPLLGVQKGETYDWLNDHTVAYTIPSNSKSKYTTYGLTRTFTDASGNQEVTVNVPPADRKMATVILNSTF